MKWEGIIPVLGALQTLGVRSRADRETAAAKQQIQEKNVSRHTIWAVRIHQKCVVEKHVHVANQLVNDAEATANCTDDHTQ